MSWRRSWASWRRLGGHDDPRSLRNAQELKNVPKTFEKNKKSKVFGRRRTSLGGDFGRLGASLAILKAPWKGFSASWRRPGGHDDPR